jgi:transposase
MTDTETSMTVDTVIDAEAIRAAQRRDKRIRLTVGTIADNMEKLYTLVEEAKADPIHAAALGFTSWTAYVADVCSAMTVRLGAAQRRELVSYLSGAGLSQRAIADATGVGVGTVNRDLAAAPVPNGTPDVTGKDGKTYKRKSTDPSPEEATELPTDLNQEEAEELTGRIREGVLKWRVSMAAAGINMTRAMAQLSPGEWSDMLANLDMSEETAALIMSFSEDPASEDIWQALMDHYFADLLHES